jgi:hypothetical protein
MSGKYPSIRRSEEAARMVVEGARAIRRWPASTDCWYAAGCAPTIEPVCRWLQVSKSGYYEWLQRPPSATTQRRELLKIKIAALFAACDGTYGYRRLHATLVAGGEQVGPELVRELMRELGLWWRLPAPRPGRSTTVQGGSTTTPDLAGKPRVRAPDSRQSFATLARLLLVHMLCRQEDSLLVCPDHDRKCLRKRTKLAATWSST